MAAIDHAVWGPDDEAWLFVDDLPFWGGVGKKLAPESFDKADVKRLKGLDNATLTARIVLEDVVFRVTHDIGSTVMMEGVNGEIDRDAVLADLDAMMARELAEFEGKAKRSDPEPEYRSAAFRGAMSAGATSDLYEEVARAALSAMPGPEALRAAERLLAAKSSEEWAKIMEGIVGKPLNKAPRKSSADAEEVSVEALWALGKFVVYIDGTQERGIDPAQRAAYEAFCARQAEIGEAALAAVTAYAKERAEEDEDFFEYAEFKAPVTVDKVRDRIVLTSVSVREPEGAGVEIALGLATTWDTEHGLAAVVRDGRVDRVVMGGDE